MRRGNSNSPAEAGSLQTNPVVSNPLLGGGVFDPSDIPFLPFSGPGFASRNGSFNAHESIEGVTHERGKFTQGLGNLSHARR
jgi:hypothetical protein